MAWTECQYSRGQIDVAGGHLVALDPSDPRRDDALEKIGNWRSCHSYPLHIVTKTLQERARTKVSRTALVARRIKRLASIAIKLRHNPAMKLSQMQDIGGCRAVLNSVTEAEHLALVYDEAFVKHPNVTDRPYVLKKYDYIREPKSDGYRGIHLIMRYQSTSKKAYNGQRIEIQIRSRLQHAWATSVETCQAFTGQALKSKVKSATESWLRFFCLMSAAIAEREKRPIVPGTPQQKRERKEELRELEKQEKIIMLLSGWSTAMEHPSFADELDSFAFLLELNVTKRRLMVNGYKKNEMPAAHANYLLREKETESDPNIQVVLVSSNSVSNLKRAYPNFYVDTKAFISAIQQEIN